MDPFRPKTLAFAFVVASLLALRARRRQTLTAAGAASGFCVGFILCSTGLRGLVLVFFYQLGSWATKYKKQAKAAMDATADLHSVRGAKQVLAVSALAAALSLYHAAAYGPERPLHFRLHPGPTRVACAVLAHHCTSLADTWASELGMALAGARGGGGGGGPVLLITNPWRRVPRGTNGGVTIVGTLCSLAGGLVMAALTLAMDVLSGTAVVQPVRVLAYGTLCGFVGSALDSWLGATVQATYYDEDARRVVPPSRSSSSSSNVKHVCGHDWLTNEQVNLVSTVATTALGSWLLAPWMLQ